MTRQCVGWEENDRRCLHYMADTVQDLRSVHAHVKHCPKLFPTVEDKS